MDASSTYQDSLPVSSDALLGKLRELGISFESYEHVPLRTVEDSKLVQGSIVPTSDDRVNIKNLYLRDKKKRNYLVVLEQDRDIDLKVLGEMIGAGRVSFGSADRLMENLGVRPGAVSPMTMINGVSNGVNLFIDQALKTAGLVHVHPLVNDRTIALTPDDLETVLAHWGAQVNWIEFQD